MLKNAVNCEMIFLLAGRGVRRKTKSSHVPYRIGHQDAPSEAEWGLTAIKVRRASTLDFRQSFQHLDAPFQSFILCGKADTEMSVSLAEDIAGNDEQSIFDGFCRKFRTRSA